jgi:predicted TPR repeat methyltransferase
MADRADGAPNGETIFVEQRIDRVRQEYESVAHLAESFQRAKWGSREGMINAFRLGLDVVPWPEIDRWVDVGCGEADFFEFIEEHGHRFQRLVGIDLTPSMIDKANTKRLRSPKYFAAQSLDAPDPSKLAPPFDLVTAIGVMQKSGMRPDDFSAALARLTRHEKFLFLTTKNAAWHEFTSGRLMPEAGHSWFSPREIRSCLESAGFAVLRQEGFKPRENCVVALEDSHTFFVLAQRIS